MVVDPKTIISTIHLDYPINPVPRYGYGKPAHKELHRIIGAHRDRYAAWLKSFARFNSFFERIPTLPDEDGQRPEPHWVNDYLPGFDAATLYAFLTFRNPARYFEIGSGNSTRFARRAIRDQKLRTAITSIDLFPRTECDVLCDRVVRRPVEDLDLSLFDELDAGDILFVDHSHRVFTNSDTVVTFLEIRPRLRPGVLVQFHDIFLPLDYPPKWSTWYFSEQYLLACWLLAGTNRFEIVQANAFCGQDAELRDLIMPMWKEPRFGGVRREGGSFWVEMKGDALPAAPFAAPAD